MSLSVTCFVGSGIFNLSRELAVIVSGLDAVFRGFALDPDPVAGPFDFVPVFDRRAAANASDFDGESFLFRVRFIAVAVFISSGSASTFAAVDAFGAFFIPAAVAVEFPVCRVDERVTDTVGSPVGTGGAGFVDS